MDYRYVFAATKSFTTYSSSVTAANVLRLQNGNVVIASDGVLRIYDTYGVLITCRYSAFANMSINIPRISLALLNNGNFILLSFISDQLGNTTNGYFYIFDQHGNTILGQTEITGSGLNIANASVSVLKNGNFVIAYTDKSNSNRGEFIIYNQAGNAVIAGPTVFETNTVQHTGVNTLNNGNFVINYHHSSSHGCFVIYNQAGDTTIRGPVEYNSSAQGSSPTQSAVLNNNNIVYAAAGNRGKVYIYNEAGDTLVAGPLDITDSDMLSTNPKSIVVLPNGNFLIYYGFNGIGEYNVYSESGSLITLKGVFTYSNMTGSSSYYHCLILLTTGNLLSIGHNSSSTYELNYQFDFCINRLYDPILLQKVSNNEVRLLNNTGESLEMVLSVQP